AVEYQHSTGADEGLDIRYRLHREQVDGPTQWPVTAPESIAGIGPFAVRARVEQRGEQSRRRRGEQYRLSICRIHGNRGRRPAAVSAGAGDANRERVWLAAGVLDV